MKQRKFWSARITLLSKHVAHEDIVIAGIEAANLDAAREKVTKYGRTRINALGLELPHGIYILSIAEEGRFGHEIEAPRTPASDQERDMFGAGTNNNVGGHWRGNSYYRKEFKCPIADMCELKFIGKTEGTVISLHEPPKEEPAS